MRVLATADVHGKWPVYQWLVTVAREYRVQALVLAGDLLGCPDGFDTPCLRSSPACKSTSNTANRASRRVPRAPEASFDGTVSFPRESSTAAWGCSTASRRVPLTFTLYRSILNRLDRYSIQSKIWSTLEDLAVGPKPQKALARGDQQVILTCIERSEMTRIPEQNFRTGLLLRVNDVHSVPETYKHMFAPDERVLECERLGG